MVHDNKKHTHFMINFFIFTVTSQAWLEGCVFDSWWCHWNFSLT